MSASLRIMPPDRHSLLAVVTYMHILNGVGMERYECFVPALGRQRLGDLYEFVLTAMVCIAISGPARLHGETLSQSKQTSIFLSLF